MTSRTRLIVFINTAHTFTHYSLLILPTAVLAMVAPTGRFGDSYAHILALTTGTFMLYGACAGTWLRHPPVYATWNRMVTLEIAPHPDLDPHQRRVIARDYGMNAKQRLHLKVREAVLFYVRRRFGLTEGHEQRPAQEQHIVLLGIA